MTRDRVRRTNDGYYGDGYWLIDNRTNGLVLGEQIARGVNIGYHLDAVEEWQRDMAQGRSSHVSPAGFVSVPWCNDIRNAGQVRRRRPPRQ